MQVNDERCALLALCGCGTAILPRIAPRLARCVKTNMRIENECIQADHAPNPANSAQWLIENHESSQGNCYQDHHLAQNQGKSGKLPAGR